MTDRDALLRGILLDPSDDAARLVYADALEESDDPAAVAYAEFIRLQCRIAALEAECGCGRCVRLRGGGQHHNGPCAVDREREPTPAGGSTQAFLRRRERDLMEGAALHWLRDAFPAIDPDRYEYRQESGHVVEFGEAILTTAWFRRGFVDEVHLPLAAWLTHGPAVVAAHPVTRVVVTDVRPQVVEPYLRAGAVERLAGVDDVGDPGEAYFRQWHNPLGGIHHDLPGELFDLLVKAGKVYPDNGHLVFFSNADIALDALSRACLTWASGKAGLPPIPAGGSKGLS